MSSCLIRSCTFVFYIALFLTLPARGATLSCAGCALQFAAQTSGSTVSEEDPDALYRNRTDLAQARKAADIWSKRLAANPKDFDSAWKLARIDYWIGTQAPTAERRPALERGTEAGRTASMLEASRPEGFFWMAANMGALAESFGMRQGLKYRGPIKSALETVLRIDPAWQNGSADRALGRWYFKVPGLFGGSKKESEAHLRKSLTYDPNSTASHYFLAETLLDEDRDAEAREELQKVLDAPVSAEWGPEDRDFKQKAQQLLARQSKK